MNARAGTPGDRTSVSSNNSGSRHNRNESQRNVNIGEVVFEPDDPKAIPAELASIMSLMSSLQVRCYYEGRFVLLKDLDNDGKPPLNREWREVYCQLVGCVLQIWDSWELEKSSVSPNSDGIPAHAMSAVKPTYINIADASLKIIENVHSGPKSVTNDSAHSIDNVIALSTTFRNRYLLKFSSKQTMLIWAAALRLSMFELVSLQQAYTGALLAARGIKLSDIKQLLQPTKFKHQDSALVRFGTGMPWTKCWAVVTPAGYKKRKQNKFGHIDFYESEKAKQKKQAPMATISGARAAYAVFPESSMLINQSTLLKIEGTIAVREGKKNGEPRDGFIFIMPELHPSVPGFETLIRFLIPTLDSFNLYGRPSRFIADKFDMRSLMFGLPDPPSTRYVDLADV
ncbi:hypothetical protein V1511DRAFT_461360, partial [Dipodascopsis uninucleata]